MLIGAVTRAVKGQKTGKKDSKWIADLLKLDHAKTSFIPPKDIRECREIARCRFKLACMKASEKNRYQSCMTVSDIGLASAPSDAFGAMLLAIMDYVANSAGFDEGRCISLVKRGVGKKTDRIVASVRDCGIGPDQRLEAPRAGVLRYIAALPLRKRCCAIIKVLTPGSTRG